MTITARKVFPQKYGLQGYRSQSTLRTTEGTTAMTMRILLFLTTVWCMALSQTPTVFAQSPNNKGGVKGDSLQPAPRTELDTPFVFQSARPLISNEEDTRKSNSSLGVDLLFSGNGFGAGFFWQRSFGDDFVGFMHLGISGARNSSEFENAYDPISGQFYVPGKVNRLYMLPLTIGTNVKVFQNSLNENMRPYISAGFGPTFIFATPYEREFFNSLGYATSYTRVGGFVGIGTYVGTPLKSTLAINIRYYYIPFGGDGLESVRNSPIKDFGGLFLSLSIGMR